MAVYTVIDRDKLAAFLELYDVGTLVAYEGIAAGVSNTNYLARTERADYILTLFEPHRVRDEDIPFFTDYTNKMYEIGLPVPEILTGRDGEQIRMLCRRPACLFAFLEGASIPAAKLTPELCGEAGAMLAHMHLATARMDRINPDPYGPNKWREWIETMPEELNALSAGLHQRCVALYNEMAAYPCGELTSGPIHGDYFPDNVFFQDGELCGVIDFHFASTGWFVYDLAIAVNAWCFNADNEFDEGRYAEMMRGYQTFMPLEPQEYDAMPLMLRLAAMRFLLSRVEEKRDWTPDRLGQPHDPAVFLKRLEHFSA